MCPAALPLDPGMSPCGVREYTIFEILTGYGAKGDAQWPCVS
jgi:hypothetical protein